MAIDGKTVRDSANDGRHALHLVSAWCSGNGLSLGQIATAEKSDEITAIPELPKALNLSGASVTIDAMGTQHEIAQEIIYVLMVKDNQPTLAESLRDWFASVQVGGLDRPYWEHTTHDKGHGRIETRVCRVSEDVQWLADMGQHWADIQRIAMVERKREVGERISVEHAYCISSRPVKAIEMSRLVRAHWGIENQLHWVLDVTWGEDAHQTPDRAAARNMASLRKITLNLARMEQQRRPKKVSLKNIRNLPAWDTDVRESILSLI